MAGNAEITAEGEDFDTFMKALNTVTIDLNGQKVTGPDDGKANWYAFIVDGGDLTLKDSVLKEIARQILLSSGISCDSLHITKIIRAVTYIELDENGKLSALGYEISLNLTVNGKAYTLDQTVSVTVTSHNSAKVKVIYIDVDEDEE